MNKQREVVYTLRRDALLDPDVTPILTEMIEETVDDILEQCVDPNLPSEEWDWELLSLEYTSTFLVPLPVADEERESIGQDVLRDHLLETAIEARSAKRERLGADLTEQLERYVVLRTIDELWKDHLHELDMLRSGIGLRAYGQKDPLLEYKSESFQLFGDMMTRARKETVSRFFRLEVAMKPSPDAVLRGGAARKPDAGAPTAAEDASRRRPRRDRLWAPRPVLRNWRACSTRRVPARTRCRPWGGSDRTTEGPDRGP